jgi:DNA-directed RNA polymerase subunit RPC12/RpoP
MPESFDCPNCGAPVPLGDKPPSTVRCPHCSTTVIVPESLRAAPEPRPVVIQIDARRSATGVPSRLGRAVAIGVVIVVLFSVGVGLIGMVAGIGVAVAPVLPALLPGDDSPAALVSFGGEGIGPGRFTDARSIAVDGEGRIYVGEYQGGRVQVFREDGEFVTQWFADREMPLTGMAVTPGWHGLHGPARRAGPP